MRSRIYRKRPIDYILPFLVIIGLGVIAVLGYQIWSTFSQQGKADVHFYVVEGKAKVLPFGSVNWDNAYSGTKMLMGDSLKTLPLGRSVLGFFNGTLVRMGNDTAVTLIDLNKKFDSEKIALRLDNGMIWVNAKHSPDVKESLYEVRTAHLLVKAKGTVFAVENGSVETVRVLDGAVTVDVLIRAGNQERVATTLEVGVGQEMLLDEATIKAFENNQLPSTLNAISEGFKAGAWYQWNSTEDQAPTDYSSLVTAEDIAGTLATENGTQSTSTMETSGVSQQTQSTLGDDIGVATESLEAPIITMPTEGTTTVQAGPYTITGGVAANVVKVAVEQVINGKVDSYVLGKFKQGDAAFTYAVSEKFGNLLAGENVYSFYAYDKDGNKSEAARVTVNLSEAQVSGTLSAPKVVSFNGENSSIITTDSLKIDGTVEGAAKVVVNGYTLSKFVSGSTSWSYTAKEALGNLVSGENNFEVYAIGADGTKSEVTKFSVTYNKSASAANTVTATQQVGGTTTPAVTPVTPATTVPATTQPATTQQTQVKPVVIPSEGF